MASEIKAASVHYRPLPLDSRVDFSVAVIVAPPFEKCSTPGVFIQINMVFGMWIYPYLRKICTIS